MHVLHKYRSNTQTETLLPKMIYSTPHMGMYMYIFLCTNKAFLKWHVAITGCHVSDPTAVIEAHAGAPSEK